MRKKILCLKKRIIDRCLVTWTSLSSICCLLVPVPGTCIHLVPGGDNMLYYKFLVVTFLVFGELEFQQEDYILDNYIFG